tara:strand:- start:555 stop:821 length:267 start_codon:yes stop_codon:yes gene_type:complete
MPRYVYHCKECEIVFQKNHSIKEKLTDCEDCETQNSLQRIPSVITTLTKNTGDQKRQVGSLVKEYIENAKEDLKDEKKELGNQVYEDD